MQLFQSNLMDLVRAEIGGSHPSNREPIPRFSVRQRPDARVGSAMWRIVVSHKGREFSIGGNDLIVDCGKYRPTKSLLFGGRDRRRKLFQRFGKRAALAKI